MRTTTCAYLFQVPVAWVTGRTTDRIEDGHMIIELEVEAPAAARIALQASLTTDDGTPLAMIEEDLTVAEGVQPVPLRFWGGLFHDRAAPGPYRLAEVVLRGTAEYATTSRSSLGHRTAAYTLDRFDPAPANNERLLNFANQLDGYADRLAVPR